jgi:hypothetical protein
MSVETIIQSRRNLIKCQRWVKMRRTQYEYMSSALPSNSDIARRSRHFAFVPIVLKKSFWGDERKVSEPLMHLTRVDVRDHIVSPEIDCGPS